MELNLPPILDIIRGCSNQVHCLNKAVHENNRPQTRGFRRNPYDDTIFIHHTAGETLSSIQSYPSYSGVSVIEVLQQQNLELAQRVSELEQKLDRQLDLSDSILKIVTP